MSVEYIFSIAGVFTVAHIYIYIYISVYIISVCSVVTAGPSGITEDPGAQLRGHLWMKFGQGLFSPSIVVT